MTESQLISPDDASGPEQWTIILHNREIARFSLPEGSRLTIGRGREADVVIDNTAISRLHAVIEKQKGLILLSDLKSTNGVMVNGERITGAVPISGDELIYLGKFRLAAGPLADERRARARAVTPDLDEETVFVGSSPAKNRPDDDYAALSEHKLTVIQGTAKPPELSLKGRTSIKIGKNLSCDLVIAGFLVAASQCFIVAGKNRFNIVPQRSWISTRLNGLTIKRECPLRPGDLIEIGRVKIRFT